MIESGRDLHELHAADRAAAVPGIGRPGRSAVRWTALNHSLAVNRLLGFTNRVAMTQRESHTPTEASNAELCAFFRLFLANASAPDHSQ